MRWECRDWHISSAAGMALSAYHSMCWAPKTIHILMNLVFSHIVPRAFHGNFGRDESLRHSIWNESAGTAILALQPVRHSPPIVNVSSAKHCSYYYGFCFCPIIFRAFQSDFGRDESLRHSIWNRKCLDCHIGLAASVTLSTYRLMCRTPNDVHILMNFVFAHYFSRILFEFWLPRMPRHSSNWHYHTRRHFIKTNRRKCRVIRSNWHQHFRSTFFNVGVKNVSFVS